MNILRLMISRHWLLTTLLVLTGMAICIRLGIWQLDRLEQRRAWNTRVLAQLEQPPLELTKEALQADLAAMEYRQVMVQGEYLHEYEIALRNQYYGNQWGVHLLTPLRIAGSNRLILVDRGWISAEDFNRGDWSAFQEPGLVTVRGVLRAPQSRADFGSRSDPTPAPDAAPMRAWNFVNIMAIDQQIPGDLLPTYIQQAPDPSWGGPPYRTQPNLEITEGPHLGYALQWFTFAAILGLGYPFFIKRQEQTRVRQQVRLESPV